MARKTAATKKGGKKTRNLGAGEEKARVNKPKHHPHRTRGQDEQDADVETKHPSHVTRGTKSSPEKKGKKTEAEERTVETRSGGRTIRKKVKTKPVKVKAVRAGYYGDILRKPGAKFVMNLTDEEIESQDEDDEMDRSPSWIKILGEDKKKAASKRKKAEEAEAEDEEDEDADEDEEDTDEDEDEDDDESEDDEDEESDEDEDDI